MSHAARQIIEAAGVSIEWEEVAVRADAEKAQGELAYGDGVASVRRNGVALKGPMATAIAGGRRASKWACAKPSSCMRTYVR